MKGGKRLIAALAVIPLLFIACLPAAAEKEKRYTLPEDTILRATSAIVVALGTTEKDDRVLFEREADALISPGAMVRIAVGMTALQIIDENGIDIDTATGTYTDACSKAIRGSGLSLAGMKVGETWTVRDLLAVSMITTAADAVQTLTVTLCETERAFVQRMNRWVQSIGCENTSFGDAFGLGGDGRGTTVRDMVKITRQVNTAPLLENLLSSEKYTVNPVEKGRRRSFSNVNELIRSGSEQYYAALAYGRSGYTERSGRCLASVARADGYEYLVVVAGCPQKVEGLPDGTSHYFDTRTLFRWAFRNFTAHTIIGAGDPVGRAPVQYALFQSDVTLLARDALVVILHDDIDPSQLKRQLVLDKTPLSAPLNKGDACGTVRFVDEDGVVYGETALTVSRSVSRSALAYGATVAVRVLRSPWFYGSAALVGLLIVAYIAVCLVRAHRHRRGDTRPRSRQ